MPKATYRMDKIARPSTTTCWTIRQIQSSCAAKGPALRRRSSGSNIRNPRESPTSIESSLAKNEVVKVYGIYFSFNSADIRPESERVLKEIAEVLVAHPDWKLRVDGHTDGIGNATDNLDLSKRRAAAVKDALVSRYGIDAARLTTEGYGESSPQDTNETQEGRARNRRVELRRQ